MKAAAADLCELEAQAPEIVVDVRAMARPHTETLIRGLVEMAQNPDVSPTARILASREILNRGHGMPAQSISLEGAPQIPMFVIATMPSLSPPEPQPQLGDIEGQIVPESPTS